VEKLLKVSWESTVEEMKWREESRHLRRGQGGSVWWWRKHEGGLREFETTETGGQRLLKTLGGEVINEKSIQLVL